MGGALVITRIDYESADGRRDAVIERNGSGEGVFWDVTITGHADRTDEAPGRVDESHIRPKLTHAQQIARIWCDQRRRP